MRESNKAVSRYPRHAIFSPSLTPLLLTPHCLSKYSLDSRRREVERRMTRASILPSLLFILIQFTAKSALSLPTFFPRSPQQSLAQSYIKTAKESKLPYTTHFFPQELDHFTFRPKSYSVFYQKYLINSTYWDQGPTHTAPIFVYTGNEGDIDWFAANTGFMMDIAPKFRALLVFIEVHIYGFMQELHIQPLFYQFGHSSTLVYCFSIGFMGSLCHLARTRISPRRSWAI